MSYLLPAESQSPFQRDQARLCCSNNNQKYPESQWLHIIQFIFFSFEAHCRLCTTLQSRSFLVGSEFQIASKSAGSELVTMIKSFLLGMTSNICAHILLGEASHMATLNLGAGLRLLVYQKPRTSIFSESR